MFARNLIVYVVDIIVVVSVATFVLLLLMILISSCTAITHIDMFTSTLTLLWLYTMVYAAIPVA